MKKLAALLLFGPLFPLPAAAFTVTSAPNAYMVENTTGTDPSGNPCYEFQTTPTCAASITNLTATISSGSIPSGSTFYIQNTGTPTTATQVFSVSSGTVTLLSAPTVISSITFQKTVTISSNVIDGSGSQGTTGQSLQSNAGSAPTWVNVPSAILSTTSSWTAAQTFSSATITNLGVSSMTTTLPMSGRKITGLANGTAATDAAAFGQIHYMASPVSQTVNASSSTQVTAAFVPTGQTATITPTSASSKIKITVSGLLSVSGASISNSGFSTIDRGTTNLGDATNGFASVNDLVATQTAEVPCSMSFLDSPATTSATSYTVYIKNGNATNTTFWCRIGVCSIILEEVQ